MSTDRSVTTDLTPEEIALMDELFGRFPDHYVQPALSPEIEAYISEHHSARGQAA